MLNSRILGLIWRGTAYFLVNDKYFLNWWVATAIEVRVAERRRPIFWRQIKSLKTQIVQMFLFDMFLPNYKSLFFMNAFPSEKRYPTSMAFWHQADWHTNLPLFQGARADHVRVESSSCCFPRELWSFVRPRASWRFDQWHVTRSPPIRKRIWVGRYNNRYWGLQVC